MGDVVGAVVNEDTDGHVANAGDLLWYPFPQR